MIRTDWLRHYHHHRRLCHVREKLLTDPVTMEERHPPTEHLTEHSVLPCMPRPLTQGEALQMKLRAKGEDEAFRLANPHHDKEHPRYRGMCQSLGNPIFSDTPVDPPTYRRPIITLGTTGYSRPIQHPMYTTTSATYGQQPSPEHFPVVFFARDSTLSKAQSPGGNYEDTHFTTELDREYY